MKTFEIQHLRGRRILASFTVRAPDRMSADRKSKKRREQLEITRYRIAEVKPDAFRQRHGGYHHRSWNWRHH